MYGRNTETIQVMKKGPIINATSLGSYLAVHYKQIDLEINNN